MAIRHHDNEVIENISLQRQKKGQRCGGVEVEERGPSCLAGCFSASESLVAVPLEARLPGHGLHETSLCPCYQSSLFTSASSTGFLHLSCKVSSLFQRAEDIFSVCGRHNGESCSAIERVASDSKIRSVSGIIEVDAERPQVAGRHTARARTWASGRLGIDSGLCHIPAVRCWAMFLTFMEPVSSVEWGAKAYLIQLL